MYVYAECPRCHSSIDFVEQLAKHEAEEGDQGVITNTLIGSMWCTHCKKYTVVVTIQPIEETLLPRVNFEINRDKRRLTT